MNQNIIKNILVITLLLTFLLGCNNGNEKLIGEWSYNYSTTNDHDFFYSNIKFTNDSIELTDEFQQKIKYPIKISNSTFSFFNRKLIYKFNNEGDLIIDSVVFVKEGSEGFENLNLLSIELPKINGNIDLRDLDQNYVTIFYGRRDGNSNSLQLNDIYASVQELPSWLDCHHCLVKSKIFLAIDKYVKMDEVEKILITLQMLNRREIITLSSDSIAQLSKTTKGLKSNLPPLLENERKHIDKPHPQVQWLGLKSIVENKNYTLINHSSSNLLLDSIRIQESNIKNIIVEKLKGNPTLTIIYTYELDMTYEEYTKIKDKIFSAYNELKNPINFIELKKESWVNEFNSTIK